MALLAVLLALTPAKTVGAQLDPVILGHAVEATVQLSIVVDGTVDGEEQIIWYAVGSGTIVSPDGLILTNQHLITPAGVNDKLAELEAQLAKDGKQAELAVDPERFMVAISDGRHLPEPRYSAWVAASDPDLDLAVLRIDSDARGGPLDLAALHLPVAPLGDSDAIKVTLVEVRSIVPAS
jgi:S1-C subfamily serine protease